jgi:hypothetical protein
MIQKQDLVEFEELLNGLLKKIAANTDTLIDPRYRVVKDDIAFICALGMLEMVTKYCHETAKGNKYKPFFESLRKIIEDFKETDDFNGYMVTTTFLYATVRDARYDVTTEELVKIVQGKFEERKRSNK